MGKKRIIAIDLSKEEKPKKPDSPGETSRRIVKSGKQHGRIADMGAIMLEEMKKRQEAKKEGPLRDGPPAGRAGRMDSSEVADKKKKPSPPKKIVRPKKVRSQRYRALKKLIKADKVYPLSEAVELLKKMANAKFEETVELHLVPSAHIKIGKVSWPRKKLEEKIQSLIETIGLDKIKKAVLTSTMSPGIKIALLGKNSTPKR